MYDESFVAKIAAFMQKMKANVSEEQAKKYQEGISEKMALEKLKPFLEERKVVILKNTDGLEARLNKKSVKKLASGVAFKKSLDNGFTKEQHFAAISDIGKLYENSIKILTRGDRGGYPDVTIHRLAAPTFEDNGALITIRESILHGKKIYSLELIELGKLEGILTKDLNKASRPATSNPTHNIQKNS